jgi:hypothetical protein
METKGKGQKQTRVQETVAGPTEEAPKPASLDWKTLVELGEISSPHGRTALGVNVVEDLIAVALISLVSGFVATGIPDLEGTARVLGVLLLFVAVTVVAGYVVVPRLVSHVARFHVSDVLVVTEVYGAGEAIIPGVSGGQIAEGALDHGHRHAMFIPDKEAIPELVLPLLRPGGRRHVDAKPPEDRRHSHSMPVCALEEPLAHDAVGIDKKYPRVRHAVVPSGGLHLFVEDSKTSDDR